jgi:hypothetical protein
VPPLPGASSVTADSTTNPPQNLNNNTHLQLLQMAGMPAPTKGDQEENSETLFQQLYALGNNANYGVQNQYVHHSMFGANAYDASQCDYGPILASMAKGEPEDCF